MTEIKLTPMEGARAVMDEYNIKLIYGDGNEIELHRYGNCDCCVEVTDCNDDNQVAAVIMAFIQGLVSDQR